MKCVVILIGVKLENKNDSGNKLECFSKTYILNV